MSRTTVLPEWWNGRRGGLKIRWMMSPCGFESRLGHQVRKIPFVEPTEGFLYALMLMYVTRSGIIVTRNDTKGFLI